jgi:multidrug resistance efflux pump
MYTTDDLRNLSDEDKRRKKHSVEMELVVLESDNKKISSEKVLLDMDIRKLKIDAERTRITLDEKTKRLEKVNYQVMQNEEQIKKLKKELNYL